MHSKWPIWLQPRKGRLYFGVMVGHFLPLNLNLKRLHLHTSKCLHMSEINTICSWLKLSASSVWHNSSTKAQQLKKKKKKQLIWLVGGLSSSWNWALKWHSPLLPLAIFLLMSRETLWDCTINAYRRRLASFSPRLLRYPRQKPEKKKKQKSHHLIKRVDLWPCCVSTYKTIRWTLEKTR